MNSRRLHRTVSSPTGCAQDTHDSPAKETPRRKIPLSMRYGVDATAKPLPDQILPFRPQNLYDKFGNALRTLPQNSKKFRPFSAWRLTFMLQMEKM
jgi:hypothetical protein